MILAAGFDPTGPLVSFGVLGIIVLLMLTGYLYPKPSYDQLAADKKAAEDKRDELAQVMAEQVIPVLSATTSQVIPSLARIESALARRGP